MMIIFYNRALLAPSEAKILTGVGGGGFAVIQSQRRKVNTIRILNYKF